MADAGTMLYEGKAKRLFATTDSNVLRSQFKDDATAFNAEKTGQIAGKGVANCTIAAYIFRYLEQRGVPNHFIAQTAPDEMRVKNVTILKIEVIARNRAAGSICKTLGLERGQAIEPPLVEFFYKNDDLGDPLITTDRIRLLDLATPEQVEISRSQTLRVNRLLRDFFQRSQLELVDFKLEFGVDAGGHVLLADEISPDTCRLWDLADGRVLDKDLFRFDLGDPVAGYQEVLQRVRQTAPALIDNLDGVDPNA
ncbi:MAG: phosphoribosylaminoimidazolesuccinocarboxamide synthase [Cyanobacteria bacterium P01_D01_bin.123]